MTSPLACDDEVLLRHAAGRLDPGFSLVLETHLELSATAREIHAGFESIGGLLLEEMTPAPVSAAALNKALAAIDRREEPPPPRPRATHPPTPAGFILPTPLAEREIGPWRWIAPGVRSSRVGLARASASSAFLLEIASGVRTPRHGHAGEEMTCVLRGSFSDGERHYAAGALACADATVEHEIIVDSDAPCLCLIALEGRTRPSHWLGRIYQRFRDL